MPKGQIGLSAQVENLKIRLSVIFTYMSWAYQKSWRVQRPSDRQRGCVFEQLDKRCCALEPRNYVKWLCSHSMWDLCQRNYHDSLASCTAMKNCDDNDVVTDFKYHQILPPPTQCWYQRQGGGGERKWGAKHITAASLISRTGPQWPKLLISISSSSTSSNPLTDVHTRSHSYMEHFLAPGGLVRLRSL